MGFWLFLLFFWMNESTVLHIRWWQHVSVTLAGISFALFLYYPLVYGLIPLVQQRRFGAALLFFVPYYIGAVILRRYHIELVVQWYNLKNTWVVGQDFWPSLYKSQLRPATLLQTFFSSLTSLVELIFIPLTLKFFRYAYRLQLRQAWLAQQNVQLQLTTLKAQINPHFFFNTLNNLQSFIVQQQQHRSVDLLTKLADFMRTSLYDCSEEYISMEKEIELLSNYVAIERVRFDDRAAIRWAVRDHDPLYAIPPFVFLPFIENAFKHGGSLPTDELSIQIALSNEPQQVTLSIRNRYYQQKGEHKQQGIGLRNVRQRLDHYYPGCYRLVTSQLEGEFWLELEIHKL
ncbi:MAG: hypothetical protein EOO38_14565 [Cytophagaceae bacterium]|nr:MAG: hypothetical protein EOO38_14565 [Cytophagaceae bacterium]